MPDYLRVELKETRRTCLSGIFFPSSHARFKFYTRVQGYNDLFRLAYYP
jgi:hypothetical protein